MSRRNHEATNNELFSENESDGVKTQWHSLFSLPTFFLLLSPPILSRTKRCPMVASIFFDRVGQLEILHKKVGSSLIFFFKSGHVVKYAIDSIRKRVSTAIHFRCHLRFHCYFLFPAFTGKIG